MNTGAVLRTSQCWRTAADHRSIGVSFFFICITRRGHQLVLHYCVDLDRNSSELMKAIIIQRIDEGTALLIQQEAS